MLPRCYDAVAQGHIASRWLRRSVAVMLPYYGAEWIRDVSPK